MQELVSSRPIFAIFRHLVYSNCLLLIHFNYFCLRISVANFSSLDRKSRRSNEGWWHCWWPWLTFEGHFRYYGKYRIYTERSQLLQRWDVISEMTIAWNKGYVLQNCDTRRDLPCLRLPCMQAPKAASWVQPARRSVMVECTQVIRQDRTPVCYRFEYYLENCAFSLLRCMDETCTMELLWYAWSWFSASRCIFFCENMHEKNYHI